LKQKSKVEFGGTPLQVRITVGVHGLVCRHSSTAGFEPRFHLQAPFSKVTEIETIPPQLPPLAEAEEPVPKQPMHPWGNAVAGAGAGTLVGRAIEQSSRTAERSVRHFGTMGASLWWSAGGRETWTAVPFR
jgi:hypothetical protein